MALLKRVLLYIAVIMVSWALACLVLGCLALLGNANVGDTPHIEPRVFLGDTVSIMVDKADCKNLATCPK